MTPLLFAAIALVAFCNATSSYAGYAATQGWPTGAFYSRARPRGLIFIYGLMIWAALAVLMEDRDWSAIWRVPLVIVAGLLLSFAVTTAFRSRTQIVAPLGIIASWAATIVL